MVGGLSGAAGAITGILVMTCFTEFIHSGQHLAFEPKSKFWKIVKKRHLAHHFHNEDGNYGIAEFFWDKLCRTFYAETTNKARSPTARKLGYTNEIAEKYPWVKALDDTEPKSTQAMRSKAV